MQLSPPTLCEQKIAEYAKQNQHNKLYVTFKRCGDLYDDKHFHKRSYVSRARGTTPGTVVREIININAMAALQDVSIPDIQRVYSVHNTADVAFSSSKLKCTLEDPEARRLTFDAKMKVVKDITQTIMQAHRIGLAHNDIKVENMMLSHNNKGVLIDWGNSSWQGARHIPVSSVTSRVAVAPGKANAGSPSDIWAFGTAMLEFLWEVDLHELLFAVGDDLATYHEILLSHTAHTVWQQNSNTPDTNWIVACLQKNPTKRPDASQLYFLTHQEHMYVPRRSHIFAEDEHRWPSLLRKKNPGVKIYILDIIVRMMGWDQDEFRNDQDSKDLMDVLLDIQICSNKK